MSLRVAVLTPSVSRRAGGLFTSVRRLAQSVAALPPATVEVLSLRDKFTDADLSHWEPLPVRIFPVAGPAQFAYSSALKPALLAGDADLAHVHGLWLYPSVAVSVWHRRTRRPYMISPRGMLDPWALANSRWKKRVAGWLFEDAHLRRAACLHALCASEARSMRAYGLRNPIAIIPNGIDLPVGTEGKPGANVPAAPWQGHIEAGRRVMLFLSRIHPKKGLANLLRAWASVQGSTAGVRQTGWVLAIAGWEEGGHEAELKRLATELALPWADIRDPVPDGRAPVSILFLGPQFNEGKAACYTHCDAFVLPSLSEGLPMVVLEAWAYAKPVLMTPECNLPEGFAANAANAIGTDAPGIARGLAEFLPAQSAALAELGANGQRLIATKFTWEAVAAETKAVYEALLGGGSLPACVETG